MSGQAGGIVVQIPTRPDCWHVPSRNLQNVSIGQSEFATQGVQVGCMLFGSPGSVQLSNSSRSRAPSSSRSIPMRRCEPKGVTVNGQPVLDKIVLSEGARIEAYGATFTFRFANKDL